MLSRRTFVSLAAATLPRRDWQPPTAPAPKTQFHEKGGVRSATRRSARFPLLVTLGGGLNSRISNWATAVFNAPESFKSDFRVTLRTSATPTAASPPARSRSTTHGALADDQLGRWTTSASRNFSSGLLHRRSVCPQAMERAPDRVAGVCCQPVGTGWTIRTICTSPARGWAGAAQAAARPGHGDHREVPAQPLPGPARLFVYSVTRTSRGPARRQSCPARRHPSAPVPDRHGHRVAGAERGGAGLSLEAAARFESPHRRAGAQFPQGASTRHSGPLI